MVDGIKNDRFEACGIGGGIALHFQTSVAQMRRKVMRAKARMRESTPASSSRNFNSLTIKFGCYQKLVEHAI